MLQTAWSARPQDSRPAMARLAVGRAAAVVCFSLPVAIGVTP
ncbi:hypothetical protein ACIG3E_22695 [Streptomyces sp. NPDC053474]